MQNAHAQEAIEKKAVEETKNTSVEDANENTDVPQDKENPDVQVNERSAVHRANKTAVPDHESDSRATAVSTRSMRCLVPND